ncbi:unnamed protein product [Leuciscus chuanchicus]
MSLAHQKKSVSPQERWRTGTLLKHRLLLLLPPSLKLPPVALSLSPVSGCLETRHRAMDGKAIYCSPLRYALQRTVPGLLFLCSVPPRRRKPRQLEPGSLGDEPVPVNSRNSRPKPSNSSLRYEYSLPLYLGCAHADAVLHKFVSQRRPTRTWTESYIAQSSPDVGGKVALSLIVLLRRGGLQGFKTDPHLHDTTSPRLRAAVSRVQSTKMLQSLSFTRYKQSLASAAFSHVQSTEGLQLLTQSHDISSPLPQQRSVVYSAQRSHSCFRVETCYLQSVKQFSHSLTHAV